MEADAKLRREALSEIPQGYYQVRDGKIEPDDMVWCWTTKEWLRGDDPQWGPHAVLIEDCICVARSVEKHKPQGTRFYTVNR